MYRTMFALTGLAAVVAAAALVGAAGGASKATMAQAQAAGWDCSPEITIVGYFHCAPPGKPSVADMIAGTTDVPMIVLRIFNDNADRTFAGIETLLRADLYSGQPCPQDNLATWDLLPFGYYACHRFDA
jgi:hypothetical protein